MTLGSARGWHKWVSIALLIPLFIVGATAVFIAHGKSLGTERVALPSGLGESGMKVDGVIVRDITSFGDMALVATQRGLFEVRGAEFHAAPGLPKEDFRSIAASANGEAIAASKMGLWKRDANGAWTILRKGDYQSVSAVNGALVAYAKDEGLVRSSDGGKTWTADATFNKLSLSAAKEPEPYTLNKLVMDLHTGKFFLGKTSEWLWIDIVGLTLVLLCLTGGWVWWKGQRQKSQGA